MPTRGFFIYRCPSCLAQETTNSKSANQVSSQQCTHTNHNTAHTTTFNDQVSTTTTTTTETPEDNPFQVDYNDNGLDEAIQNVKESIESNKLVSVQIERLLAYNGKRPRAEE